MKKKMAALSAAYAILLPLEACHKKNDRNSDPSSQVNDQLKTLVKVQELQALGLPTKQDPALVELGRNLFFEKALSAENDTACSSCHSPSAALSNAEVLPIGPGGQGVGKDRTWREQRVFQWRNSPGIYNRALPEWKALTFASHVHLDENDKPTGVPVVYPLASVKNGSMGMLEIQAHFPPTGRDNMLGMPNTNNTLNQGDDLQIRSFNHLDASYPTPRDFVIDVWDKLTKKILKIDGYRELIAKAYPDLKESDIKFLHLGRAIAAFEAESFVFSHSPWDDYLRGNGDSLTTEQKQGALLFYGKATCSTCHSGPLLTDQLHHNIGVPNIGPGPQPVQQVPNKFLDDMSAALGYTGEKTTAPLLDYGRAQFAKTKAEVDEQLFTFRTISLHNVELSGPYFHNGSALTLEEVIEHHTDAVGALKNYDPEPVRQILSKLTDDEQAAWLMKPSKSKELAELMAKNIDPRVKKGAIVLSESEKKQIIAFLKALTDPAVRVLQKDYADVKTPSGLPIDN